MRKHQRGRVSRNDNPAKQTQLLSPQRLERFKTRPIEWRRALELARFEPLSLPQSVSSSPLSSGKVETLGWRTA